KPPPEATTVPPCTSDPTLSVSDAVALVVPVTVSPAVAVRPLLAPVAVRVYAPTAVGGGEGTFITGRVPEPSACAAAREPLCPLSATTIVSPAAKPLPETVTVPPAVVVVVLTVIAAGTPLPMTVLPVTVRKVLAASLLLAPVAVIV